MTEEQIAEITYIYETYKITEMSLNSVIAACNGIHQKQKNSSKHCRTYMAKKHNIKNLDKHPTISKNKWLTEIYLHPNPDDNLLIAKLLFKIALNLPSDSQVRIKPINEANTL